MTDGEARVAAAFEREFGVRLGRSLRLGESGPARFGARLADGTLLLVDVAGSSPDACMTMVALWEHLDGHPARRAVIVRVGTTDASSDATEDERLAAFVSARLCDEVPEQYACADLSVTETGALLGDVDALRALLA